jgi:hypothetical protein
MTIPNRETAADLVEATVRILQRNLPGGDLDDRGVIVELWGLLDTAYARSIYRPEVPEQIEPANDEG